MRNNTYNIGQFGSIFSYNCRDRRRCYFMYCYLCSLMGNLAIMRGKQYRYCRVERNDKYNNCCNLRSSAIYGKRKNSCNLLRREYLRLIGNENIAENCNPCWNLFVCAKQKQSREFRNDCVGKYTRRRIRISGKPFYRQLGNIRGSNNERSKLENKRL